MSEFIKDLERRYGKEIESVEVRKFDSERKPLRIFALGKEYRSLPLSFADLKKADKHGGDSIEMTRVYTLVFCLQNKAGKSVMSIGDAKRLSRAAGGADIVDDIYHKMNGISEDKGEMETLCFTPISLKERDEIRRKSDGCRYAYLVHQIILKALNEDGSRRYSDSDFDRLMNDCEASLVTMAVAKMSNARSVDDFLA